MVISTPLRHSLTQVHFKRIHKQKVVKLWGWGSTPSKKWLSQVNVLKNISPRKVVWSLLEVFLGFSCLGFSWTVSELREGGFGKYFALGFVCIGIAWSCDTGFCLSLRPKPCCIFLRWRCVWYFLTHHLSDKNLNNDNHFYWFHFF